MAPAFNTLVYARRLREAGFSETMAEAQAEALAEAMTETLATKQDLSELEARIDTRFHKVDARLEKIDSRLEDLETRMNLSMAKQIAELRSQLTLQMMVHTLATIGAVSALVKLL